MAIITIGSRHYKLIENLLNTLEKYGVKAEIVPDYYRYFNAKPAIDMIDDIPVINIRYVPLDNNLNRLIKRIFDIILVTIGIIIISPILHYYNHSCEVNQSRSCYFQTKKGW